MAGDLADHPVLEYLQPGPQPDDDAATHGIGCLFENVVGRLCRVGDGEQVKKIIKLFFGTHGQKPVDLTDIAPFRWEALVHVQHQRF